jgi:hypothetical protein
LPIQLIVKLNVEWGGFLMLGYVVKQA